MQVAESAMKKAGDTSLSEVMRAVEPHLFAAHPDVASSPSFLPGLHITLISLTV